MKKLIFLTMAVACFMAACKTGVATSTSDSTANYLKTIKAAALATEAAFNKKNVDSLFSYAAPGFIEYSNGGSKPMNNADSIKAGMKNFFEAFPDYKGEDLRAYADDSTVIVTGTWSGTFTKEYMKMKPTNKVYKAFDADIFTFNKAGKVTSHKSVQSDADFFYQLGIPMPPKK